nr:seryl-tRNA synthetase [Hymenolepis microstoma]
MAAKLIFDTVLRKAWRQNFHHRFFATSIKNDFHRLDCTRFIQEMRKNLLERNSKANLDEMPIGDPSKFKLIYLHGSPKNVVQPKNELDLLSNEVKINESGKRGRRSGLGFLRSSGGLGIGCGPRSYAFYDSLARLESALLKLTLDRTRKAGFRQVIVPDILPARVIERCGFRTTGERNQIFKIADRKEVGEASPFCLSGTGEMGLAGFCADGIFGGSLDTEAEFFSTLSRCYRHEVAPQESLLYRTHQFNKVEIFCVSKPNPDVADRMLAKIVDFQKDLYADLDLHFRVLEMPTSELGDPAHRKIDIEAHMPGEGIFGEISSASNCTDYQAVRLNILWREGSRPEEYPYAYTLNGTGCAVTRILKALVESHQNPDGSIELPPILWPYMNGIKKLEPGEIPVVVS